MIIAVVIPCFKVKEKILQVLQGIGKEVSRIYVVDDHCPDGSGKFAESHFKDNRMTVIYHKKNKGVGGAVITGYRAALKDECDIIVKIDGDGQMDPTLISNFIKPIERGIADYTKGNRFFDAEKAKSMPALRLFGNLLLSFVTKTSSGNWHIFDPTNGYTAIHTSTLRLIPLEKVSNSYFFESDMLFRLNIAEAVIVDIPMHSKYGDETSNLKVGKVIPEFILRNIKNLNKRILYCYFLREVNIASFELVAGICLFLFGLVFGLYHWISNAAQGESTPIGTVMIASLSVLVGFQLLLAFINFDISKRPGIPLQVKFM